MHAEKERLVRACIHAAARTVQNTRTQAGHMRLECTYDTHASRMHLRYATYLDVRSIALAFSFALRENPFPALPVESNTKQRRTTQRVTSVPIVSLRSIMRYTQPGIHHARAYIYAALRSNCSTHGAISLYITILYIYMYIRCTSHYII